jgi:hypothetical protein
MDKPAFRSYIKSLLISNLPSSTLLEMYQQQTRLSPVVHNLPSSAFPVGFNASHMLNDWEVDNQTESDNFTASVEEYIETHTFTYPPFPGLTCKAGQCTQRPNYFILNNWEWSNGAFFFGDVSMVLDPSYAREITVVLPMDTGSFAMQCSNSTNSRSTKHAPDTRASTSSSRLTGGPNINCDAWNNFSVGTMDHFNHITLAGLQAWAQPPLLTEAHLLAALFQRMFSPGQIPESSADVNYMATYNEVMVVGNVLFPDGLSYVVLQFFALFGTDTGQKVVQWAISHGIGVAWAPGFYDPGGMYGNNRTRTGLRSQLSRPLLRPGNSKLSSLAAPAAGSYPVQSTAQSFLDPTVRFIPNATASLTVQSEFRTSWDEVARARKSQPPKPETWWAGQWASAQKLAGPALQLHTLKPGYCGDTDSCVGVDANRRCLCAKPKKAQ